MTADDELQFAAAWDVRPVSEVMQAMATESELWATAARLKKYLFAGVRFFPVLTFLQDNDTSTNTTPTERRLS
jgi:hypothetical protein